MQESLIQALDKIQTFNGSKGSLYGWISQIAINKALNQIKRKRWRTVSLDAWTQDTIPEPTEAEMETIPEEKLLEWISKLPDLRRAVFNLYCIDGYSHMEIGKMLGISEKGSAGVLAKARKQLKEEIRHYLKKTSSRTNWKDTKVTFRTTALPRSTLAVPPLARRRRSVSRSSGRSSPPSRLGSPPSCSSESRRFRRTASKSFRSPWKRIVRSMTAWTRLRLLLQHR